MARKIVIDTGCLYRIGDDKKVLDLIKSCGFEYFDLTLFWKGVTEHIGVGEDYLEKAKELREYADKIGLICEQSHAFFCAGNDEDTNRIRIDYIKKDIRTASLMGAKEIVIHPAEDLSFEENIEMFKGFMPVAKECGIKIAVENVIAYKNGKPVPLCTSTPEGFVKFIDTLNDECVVACLDIGHAELDVCNTSAVEMIKALGPRLQALHIHDNDKHGDNHQIPYTNGICFKDILDTLKEYNYQGNITFEVETCYNRGYNPKSSLPFELFPAYIKLELEIGKYFADYLDK